MSWEERRADNRALWDALADRHQGSAFYDLDAIRAGRLAVRPHELAELAPVRGLTLCHLQCHLGTDTLGWAREGARVVGVDFSARSLAVARRLAEDVGLEAEFVESDVYEAPEALDGRTFDIVYTGCGALVWLPDLDLWALSVARLLKPGGLLYLSEFHPFHEMMAWDRLEIEHDYFQEEASTYQEGGDYTGEGGPFVARNHQWIHPLGEVVSAVAGAGLRIDFLHEHDGIHWRRWPSLVQRSDGAWTTPPGTPRLPLEYTLQARKT